MPKLGYSAVEPWKWAIGSAIYIDDIDATVRSHVLQAGMWSVGLIVVLGLCGWPIVRGLVRPMRAMTGAMATLAAGDTGIAVPALRRRDEIGDMARAVEVFRDTMREDDRLRGEHEAQKLTAAAEQKAALHRVAEEFEGRVGGIVAAATEMEESARLMSATTGETSRQTAAVAEATKQATAKGGVRRPRMLASRPCVLRDAPCGAPRDEEHVYLA